jgi:predicted small metal-binding protein
LFHSPTKDRRASAEEVEEVNDAISVRMKKKHNIFVIMQFMH